MNYGSYEDLKKNVEAYNVKIIIKRSKCIIFIIINHYRNEQNYFNVVFFNNGYTINTFQ